MKGKAICIQEVSKTFYFGEEYLYTDETLSPINRRVLLGQNVGYLVRFSRGEYIYFPIEKFRTFFKTKKDMRKEKLIKLNESLFI